MLVYTYALVKSLYDNGSDYIDSFWPFTIKVFPKESLQVDINFIQLALKEKFSLEIPIHSIKTILYRAIKNNHLEEIGNNYKLTKIGQDFVDTFETDREVERRLSALFEDIKQFLEENGISATEAHINDNLLSIVTKNIEPLLSFLDGEISLQKLSASTRPSLSDQIVAYIQIAEQNKPDHFKTLQDIFLGSIISTIVSPSEPTKKFEIESERFKKCQVFLDANFTFSLLGLDPKERIEPALELYALLKKFGLKLKIFSLTVDEICRVLNGYITQSSRYPKDIRVDSIYSTLRVKGWTKTDVHLFIRELDKTLSDLGIQIEQIEGIDLLNYHPANSNLRSLMKAYKGDQPLFHQNHDLFAIEKIKELRRHSIRKIEESKFFFLTSDRKLSKFNYLEMAHQSNGTICEIILDTLLTNILWLKNPRAKLSLNSIISAHSRSLFIKRRIWEKFYETLKNLKQEKKANDEAITGLFYVRHIERVLRDFGETEVDKITEEFALDQIEKASRLLARDKKREILSVKKELEKDFLTRLEKKVSIKEKEQEEEWLRRFKKIKYNIINSTQSKSNRFSNIIASFLTLVIAFGIIYLYLILKKFRIHDLLVLLIPLILSGGGLIGIWRFLRNIFRDKIYNLLKMKQLKLFDISDEFANKKIII